MTSKKEYCCVCGEELTGLVARSPSLDESKRARCLACFKSNKEKGKEKWNLF